MQRYGNILYFRYEGYPAGSQSVLDVKAAVFVMSPVTSERCRYIRRESQREHIGQIQACDSGLQHGIQNFIIPVQKTQYLTLECTAFLGLTIVMARPAFHTAEFLVGPAVPYLVSTLETDGDSSHCFLVFHMAKLVRGLENSNRELTVFLFPQHISSVFYNPARTKFFLSAYKIFLS